MSDKKPSGLEDVVVAQSSICYIDGKRGQLVYRGYDIDDLVENASFEEVAWLLWRGDLPIQSELDGLQSDLAHSMTLPQHLRDLLHTLPFDANPMRVLAIGAATLGTLDPDADDMSGGANNAKAIRLTAQLPLIMNHWHRISQDMTPLDPKVDKSLAYNLLYCMDGQEPDDYAVQTMDAALILHADHELNASTFSARVTAATLSDLHSAVVSAINTLKGPLHGGANEAVMKMLEEIGEPDKAADYVANASANKKKIMGFGHRVYKARFPCGRTRVPTDHSPAPPRAVPAFRRS